MLNLGCDGTFCVYLLYSVGRRPYEQTILLHSYSSGLIIWSLNLWDFVLCTVRHTVAFAKTTDPCALQVGWGALRSIQTYMYKCLQQQRQSLRNEMLSCDLDVAQCSRLLYGFAAECSCQCLIAFDAQLSSIVTNLLVLCQDGANRASELLLGYATVGTSHAPPKPSFNALCENVCKEDTWSQMQRICADLKTRVSFLTDCVAFKSESSEQLNSLHTDLSFSR